MRKKLSELVLQIIPVMIGVFLGFVVSDWADGRKRKAQSRLLVQNIQSEIDQNKKALEMVLDYHKMLRDSSRYYSNHEMPDEGPRFFQGTRVSSLVSSAYDTGIQTGIINELPIDMIQELNRLYTFQESYNDFGNMLMQGLIEKDFSFQKENLQKIARYLAITMTDVVIMEENLIMRYEKINLDEMKK